MKKYVHQFYAYYDFIESTGEIVYCGKGNNVRSNPNNLYHFRNRKYNDLKKKHKLKRIRIPTLNEDLAFKLEDWLMRRYHTWIDDQQHTKHACNIIGPGENRSRVLSQETKDKIGAAGKGRVQSEQTK
jgi:hypothetical protein